MNAARTARGPHRTLQIQPRLLLGILPAIIMLTAMFATTGMEYRPAALGTNPARDSGFVQSASPRRITSQSIHRSQDLLQV
ncbi:hypothetical protein GR257_38925 [Rhizobium leguminosarum]|uniref:Uncharacterized protein n=2 Tax=Rhizobium leguminosarum TaxID=384 RepID=A0A7K3VU36_RHILE|nr:hypothetical protein [Rhizobium leguminosarum]